MHTLTTSRSWSLWLIVTLCLLGCGGNDAEQGADSTDDPQATLGTADDLFRTLTDDLESVSKFSEEEQEKRADEAEALYSKMQLKVLNAKTVRIRFKMRARFEMNFTNKGVLLVDRESNKLRLEVQPGLNGTGGSPEVAVSDGKKIQAVKRKAVNETSQETKPVRRGLGDKLLVDIIVVGLRRAINSRSWVNRNTAAAFDFKMLGTDRIDTREAQVIEFGFSYVDDEGFGIGDRVAVLWIDRETSLPLKRWENLSGELIWAVTEKYDEFLINSPIDDSKFVLADNK